MPIPKAIVATTTFILLSIQFCNIELFSWSGIDAWKNLLLTLFALSTSENFSQSFLLKQYTIPLMPVNSFCILLMIDVSILSFLGMTYYLRLALLYEFWKYATLRMPRILMTSSLTSCGAVAVSAKMGTFGRMRFLKSVNCFYAGLKSCPHEDTTWHSSITILFTFTWFITFRIVSFTVSISGVMNKTLTVPAYNALKTCA